MAYVWVIFLVLGVIALVIILIYGILRYFRAYWRLSDVPNEPAKGMLEICSAMRGIATPSDADNLAHYNELYYRFKGTGPFCGFYHLLEPRALVLERDLVKQLLIRDFSNFNDRGVYNNCKQDPLSGHLYSLSGNAWRETRLRLEPIFEKAQMQTLHANVYASSEELLQAFDKALQQQPDAATPLDIGPLVRQYVLATLASCVFGLDVVQQQKYSLTEFAEMTQLALTTRRHGAYFNTLLYRYPKLARRLGVETTTRKVQQYFLALIADVVKQREESEEQPAQDYLQLLINLKTQELSTHVSDKHSNMLELRQHLSDELAAHAFGFLKSGLEPTTNTLACVLYELALHPDVQERVRQEICVGLRQHDNVLSYECVQQLKYMGQVVSETLRLHPVTPYLMRRTLSDYSVPTHKKYRLRKGMYVIIPTHAMHHDPDNFVEPERFDPERFAATENKTRDQGTWLGFGEGPRRCIGVHFAQLQMRIAIARLLTTYTFKPAEKSITIDCNEGVALIVQQLETPPVSPVEEVEEKLTWMS